MHYFTKCFVGGTVVETRDGVEECAEGAEVVLKKDGNEVGRTTTDLFGEFKFDKLEPGSGSYELAVSGSGGSASGTVEIADESVYAGTLTLA
jgi:hypothetical protein